MESTGTGREMSATSKANAINATSAELRGGYNTLDSYGQVRTCYSDTLPTIEEEGKRFAVNDTTGQADAEYYDTLDEAIEAALCWFASCHLDYTVENSDDPEAADCVAVALGDRGEAWNRFRGFSEAI